MLFLMFSLGVVEAAGSNPVTQTNLVVAEWLYRAIRRFLFFARKSALGLVWVLL